MIRFFEHRLLGLHGYDFQKKQEKPFRPFLSYRSPCAAGAACRKQDSAIHPHRHTGIACLAKSMQEKPKKHIAYRLAFPHGVFQRSGVFLPGSVTVRRKPGCRSEEGVSALTSSFTLAARTGERRSPRFRDGFYGFLLFDNLII